MYCITDVYVQNGHNVIFLISRWSSSSYWRFYNINAKIVPTKLIPLDFRYNKISRTQTLQGNFDSFYLLSKRVYFYVHDPIKFEFSKSYLNLHRQRFSEVAQHTCFAMCRMFRLA